MGRKINSEAPGKLNGKVAPGGGYLRLKGLTSTARYEWERAGRAKFVMLSWQITSADMKYSLQAMAHSHKCECVWPLKPARFTRVKVNPNYGLMLHYYLIFNSK